MLFNHKIEALKHIHEKEKKRKITLKNKIDAAIQCLKGKSVMFNISGYIRLTQRFRDEKLDIVLESCTLFDSEKDISLYQEIAGIIKKE